MSAPKPDGYQCQKPKCAGRQTSAGTCHGQPMVPYFRDADRDAAALDAMVAAAYANSNNGRIK